MYDTVLVKERALLVGIDRGDKFWPIGESLNELARLSDTAGAEVIATAIQKLDTPNPRTFVGSGKALEIAALAHDEKIDVVIFDDELTPSQQSNLEDILKVDKVIDRTALILDIFALHALSREGLLQVRLAQNKYLLPRLRGMWAHLASNRMGGGVGSRFGEGESQLEVDRRMVRKRIATIKKELERLSANRMVQRKARINAGVFRLTLVGYTNAGKSSLLNRLTAANVLAYDKLFATLDSTTRQLKLSHGEMVTLTDTVGFIQKLPTTLIEAFKSTLDEILLADLLIKVVDASSTQRDAQIRAVEDVIDQIGAGEIPSIVVYNKCDLIDDTDRTSLKIHHPDAVLISALHDEGISNFIEAVSHSLGSIQQTMSVCIPFDRGELVRVAHDRCSVLEESYDERGTRITMRCPVHWADRFAPYVCFNKEK
jgi:GTPase